MAGYRYWNQPAGLIRPEVSWRLQTHLFRVNSGPLRDYFAVGAPEHLALRDIEQWTLHRKRDCFSWSRIQRRERDRKRMLSARKPKLGVQRERKSTYRTKKDT